MNQENTEFDYPEEKNKLKRAWIWFWYNDFTRMFLILIPTYFVILVPILILFCNWMGIEHERMRIILSIIYIFVLVLAVYDNNYSNLRRIGLTEYRKPLKK